VSVQAGRADIASLVLASARTDIADFLSTVIYVYSLLIFLYIILQLLFNVGLRMPYSRTFDIFFGFLREISEPLLRIFRRIIPPLGGLDLSPLFALIALQLVNAIVVGRIIHG
jgi:YggT family protein